MTRIPMLDGWRGIAISVVVIAHFPYALWFSFTAPGQYGFHGVMIFLVLSGYLITTVLLKEGADLKQFYIRRFFRLIPAAWTYLLALVVVGFVTGVPLTSSREVMASVLCYREFLPTFASSGTAHSTGHFWTLSLEEQFYFLWPTLLLGMGAKYARWFAPILALFASGVWSDGLLIGCTLALLMNDEVIRARVTKVVPWLVFPATCLLIYFMLHHLVHIFEPTAIAILIAYGIVFNKSPWFKWLSWKPLAGLGRVSYSVYIWQTICLTPRGRWTVVGLLCLPLLAAGSYLLIELPCVRLGRKWETKREKDRRNGSMILSPALNRTIPS